MQACLMPGPGPSCFGGTGVLQPAFVLLSSPLVCSGRGSSFFRARALEQVGLVTMGHGISVSRPGIGAGVLCIAGGFLATGPPGKSTAPAYFGFTNTELTFQTDLKDDCLQSLCFMDGRLRAKEMKGLAQGHVLRKTAGAS